MTGREPWRLGRRPAGDHIPAPRRESGPMKPMAACVTSFAIPDPDTGEHVVLHAGSSRVDLSWWGFRVDPRIRKYFKFVEVRGNATRTADKSELR
jgi:hypothetical protein